MALRLSNSGYQPKTGEKCSCRPGVQRDNCPRCEGTGQVIDFAAIRARGKPASNPDLSRVRAIGSNMTEAIHGTATVLYSYETPVAVHMEGIGYFKTSKKWSTTTSKHINKWLESHGASGATLISQDEIEKLARKGSTGTVSGPFWDAIKDAVHDRKHAESE